LSEPAVVDVHNHSVPGQFVEQVRREGSRYGFSVTRLAAARDDSSTIRTSNDDVLVTTTDGGSVDVGPQKADEETRQAEMLAAGIDLRLQTISPGMLNYGAGERAAEWGARNLNDALAGCMRAFPEHISAMATVPLQFPAMAARELERVVSEHGMRSVMIGTNVNGENLDRPNFAPFWEAAEGLGVLVFIHPKYQVGMYRMSRYHLANLIGNPLETTIAAASLIFGGVLGRYPNLKIVLAHSGGFTPWICGRWRHGFDARGQEARAHGATESFDTYFDRLYFDTLIHDGPALRWLIERVGPDRIMLGTDYPATMGNWDQAGEIRKLDALTAEEKAKILSGNARRLLTAGGSTPGQDGASATPAASST